MRASCVGPALVLTTAGVVAMVTLDEAVGEVDPLVVELAGADPPLATWAQMAPATLAAAGKHRQHHARLDEASPGSTYWPGRRGVAAGHDARGDGGGDGSLAGAALADVVGQAAAGRGDGGSEAGLLEAIGSAPCCESRRATTYRASRHISSADGGGEGEGSEGEDGEDEKLHDYGRKVVRRLDTEYKKGSGK